MYKQRLQIKLGIRQYFYLKSNSKNSIKNKSFHYNTMNIIMQPTAQKEFLSISLAVQQKKMRELEVSMKLLISEFYLLTNEILRTPLQLIKKKVRSWYEIRQNQLPWWVGI